MSYGNFELTDNVMYVKGVGPRRAKALEKLNIFTKYDLLTHYPRDYEDNTSLTKICNVLDGEKVLLVGRIFNITSRDTWIRNRKATIINAYLQDDTGYIQLTWFNQKYLLTKFQNGMRLLVNGKAKVD
ncbi:MAG: DNA helicase RecG, partial [Selenomonadaceae bacterium]|nr:DNA helicase RecG [Selenomonadaceae bacterium]